MMFEGPSTGRAKAMSSWQCEEAGIAYRAYPPATMVSCLISRGSIRWLSDQSIQANYVNEQGDAAIASSAYGALKYERLARLKARCDPANRFRLNQNIARFVQKT
jgi:hypothetical protein